MSAECSNWRTATAADVKRDGVLATYQSMLKQSESLPPRIEGHNGRLWKFQTVTPQSDPSFEFSPGISKDVRGWVCDGAPNPVE